MLALLTLALLRFFWLKRGGIAILAKVNNVSILLNLLTLAMLGKCKSANFFDHGLNTIKNPLLDWSIPGRKIHYNMSLNRRNVIYKFVYFH